MKLKKKFMEKFFCKTYFEKYHKFNIRVYHHDEEGGVRRSSYHAHKVIEKEDTVEVYQACSCGHGIHTDDVREYDKEEIDAVKSGSKAFWKREGWNQPRHI